MPKDDKAEQRLYDEEMRRRTRLIREAEQVAKEKERASRAMGDSPGKAARYAQDVRDYARAERRKKG